MIILEEANVATVSGDSFGNKIAYEFHMQLQRRNKKPLLESKSFSKLLIYLTILFLDD